MAKERVGPLALAICVLWETAEKRTWQQSFALFVAVKHCGRVIIKGIGFIHPKQQKGKKEVTNWRVALNFILINLAENQSSCLCNYCGMKECS